MHFDVAYKPFDVKYKFRIGSPEYLFLWCLVLAVKWIQKGYLEMTENFYLGIHIEWARRITYTLLKWVEKCTQISSTCVVGVR